MEGAGRGGRGDERAKWVKKEALESEGNFLLGTGYSLSLAAHRKGNRKTGFLFKWGKPSSQWKCWVWNGGEGGYLCLEGKCKYSDAFELWNWFWLQPAIQRSFITASVCPVRCWPGGITTIRLWGPRSLARSTEPTGHNTLDQRHPLRLGTLGLFLLLAGAKMLCVSHERSVSVFGQNCHSLCYFPRKAQERYL